MTATEPVSHWLDELAPILARPPLGGDCEADVCVVGAGLTGLWTAYELLRARADLRVVILEARYAGFGASGRNGGWVLGELAGWPRDGRLASAAREAVERVGEAVAREAIDCDWVLGGALTVAQSEPQMRRARARAVPGSVALDAEAVRGRVAVAGACGGVLDPCCARVQPARLVRGLAAAVEAAGATVCEQTTVTTIAPGRAVSDRGTVRARHVIRATEGYTPRLPGLRRSLLPMNSAMIVTEPLGQRQWDELGWSGGETLRDAAHLFVYLQRTADGRIAIGGRGVPYRYGSRTDREGPVPSGTVTELRDRLTALFPSLAGVAVARAWHGVLGVARDWRPRVGLDGRTGLGWAGGYVGEGVAAANLAGRTLADLVLGRDSQLTRLAWVEAPARRWEPEPLRFLGVRGVYALLRAADRQEARTGRASALARVADAVAGR